MRAKSTGDGLDYTSRFGFHHEAIRSHAGTNRWVFKRISMNSNEPPEEKKNKMQKIQVTNNQKRNAVSQQLTTRKKQRTNFWFVIIIKT